MDYQKHYNMLVLKAKLRNSIDGYVEVHHVIPKALGGQDEKENLVSLTAREHFVAHRLLAKMYPDSGMVHAAWRMSNGDIGRIIKISSRTYEILRKEHARKISILLTGIKRTDEHCENISIGKLEAEKIRKELGVPHKLQGIKRNKDFCDKISRANKGKNISDEVKIKLSYMNFGENNPMFGKTHDDEARKIISDANKQQIECPYCNKVGGIAIMKRWHFEYCKQNPNGVSEWIPKMKRPSPTEETRKKIGEGNKGKGSPYKGVPQKRDTECPHCGKIGPKSNMLQWHFDNCKLKGGKDE